MSRISELNLERNTVRSNRKMDRQHKKYPFYYISSNAQIHRLESENGNDFRFMVVDPGVFDRYKYTVITCATS